MTFNKNMVEDGVKLIIEGVGDDPDRDGLKGTPERVARMYEQILNGYDEEKDIEKNIKLFQEKADDMVIVKNVPFYSFCEHHMMLFVGKLTVAYIPKGEYILGLSKLVRIARTYAKQLQVQERLTRQIADAVEKYVPNQGVAVRIEAEHYCMAIRGVRTPGTTTTTTRVTGLFKKDEKARLEFENALK